MEGYPKFKGLLVERGIKQKDIAFLLGMTISSFNNKLNGKGDFTITDVKKICTFLDLEPDIFFAKKVPKKELGIKEINYIKQ